MRSGSVRRARVNLIRAVVLSTVVALGVLFLHARKERLLSECLRYVERRLNDRGDLSVRFGGFSGDLFGHLRFKDVTVERPWLEPAQRLIFRAQEIEIRYRPLDFISKKFDSGIEVTVRRPEVHWMPRPSLKAPSFPFMGWMRQWAIGQRKSISLEVQGLDLYFGGGKKVSGIDIFYKNNLVDVQIPLDHLALMKADVSSVVRIRGHFELGSKLEEDVLGGQIQTEGSVVNWKPVATESTFDFVFSSDKLRVVTSNFLGGIEVNGEVDFPDDFAIDFEIEAANYALSNLDFLAGGTGLVSVPGRLDLKASVTGDPWEPRVQASARLHDAFAGKRSFRALDLNLEGVYPTVRLTDSRVLMPDGTVMKLADTTMEVTQLLRDKTVEGLIGAAQQDSVVWGDWEMSRKSGDGAGRPSDFLMQRNFGENANVHFKRLADTDEPGDRRRDADETDQMQVGFEYRLHAENSLKVEMREGEEFVGLERKSKF